MTRQVLIPVLGAGWVALVLAAPLPAAEPRAGSVADTLAVQTAMQQGKEFLVRNDAKSAVFVLEAQLARINGNAAYLALLRDAYRAHIQELRLANQTASIGLYMQRLQILDPGAALDSGSLPVKPIAAPQVATVETPAPMPVKPSPTIPAKAEPPAPVRAEPTIRATMEDPAGEGPKARPMPTSLLARAEEEFTNRRYKEAGQLYDQASKADPNSLATSRERWAYCKLYQVVEAINQPAASGLAWDKLETEVRLALDLAPRLEYADYLLKEIQKRRAAGKEPEGPPVEVKHFEHDQSGWARAETTHFVIHHNQSAELAGQVAQVAERTRAGMHAKWLGQAPADWEPRCDIYLHATGHDYSTATKIGLHSPGHATIQMRGGQVVGRRIDLRCDQAALLLTAVLPRETTHVTLAGQFGDKQLPRWADEGIAVLAEPRERVDGHLRNLPRLKQDNKLFPVGQLLQLNDYPDSSRITAFYAQSVSLVEFLTDQKGPQVFTAFLRDALGNGYEPALQKHYGFRTFDELNLAWLQKIGKDFTTGVAQTR
jgi:hypothetical protein